MSGAPATARSQDPDDRFLQFTVSPTEAKSGPSGLASAHGLRTAPKSDLDRRRSTKDWKWRSAPAVGGRKVRLQVVKVPGTNGTAAFGA